MVALPIDNLEDSLSTSLRAFSSCVLPPLPLFVICASKVGNDISGAKCEGLDRVLPIPVIVSLARREHIQGGLAHTIIVCCNVVEWIRRIVSQSNTAKSRADVDDAGIIGFLKEWSDLVCQNVRANNIGLERFTGCLS